MKYCVQLGVKAILAMSPKQASHILRYEGRSLTSGRGEDTCGDHAIYFS